MSATTKGRQPDKRETRSGGPGLTTVVDCVFVALLLAGAIWWTTNEFLSTPPYVDPARYPVRGIDVSAHNGMMNLKAARADGIDFIFIKASEGSSFRDENFRLNYAKAREAGMKIGAYHFFRFDVAGVPQAMNLLGAIGDRPLDIGIAVDVEQHGNPDGIAPDVVADRLTAMLEYLNLKGHRVILYTNRDGYYDLLEKDFRGQPLWICSFSNPPIATDWLFWQFNHRGRVKGIAGDVDINTFNGDSSEWYDFLVECPSSPPRPEEYAGTAAPPDSLTIAPAAQ